MTSFQNLCRDSQRVGFTNLRTIAHTIEKGIEIIVPFPFIMTD
jgi:hypothetical protein